jgi:hypothetical protein
MPDASGPPLGRGVWNDTRVELPPSLVGPHGAPLVLRDVFTGAQLQAESIEGRWTIPAAALFEQFPVSLLVPTG